MLDEATHPEPGGTTEAGPAGGPVERRDVVLCVDDERGILSALRRVLRRAGCEVVMADSGAAGLAVLEEREVDVIISDMRMPQMSGAEFLASCAARWPDTARVLLTGYSDLESAVSAVNDGGIYRYLTKPWNDDDLCLTVREAVSKRRMKAERDALTSRISEQNDELRSMNEKLEERVRARTAQLQKTTDSLRKAYDVIKENFRSTLGTFSHIIEMREGCAQGHSRRVAEMAQALGEALDMQAEELDDLHNAALLHDIGKFALPDALINTPYGQLGAEQRAEFNRHAELGEAALLMLEPLANTARITRHHHERYDGEGYPDGIAGDAIPLAARVLAIVNDYDDLLEGNLVAERYTSDQAQAMLKVNAGKRYDPAMVEAFLRILAERAAVADGPTRAVGLLELEAGMRIGRDVVYKGQVVLLRENQVLNDNLIKRLRQLLTTPGEDVVIHVRDPL